jgi:hypothetical protein
MLRWSCQSHSHKQSDTRSNHITTMPSRTDTQQGSEWQTGPSNHCVGTTSLLPRDAEEDTDDDAPSAGEDITTPPTSDNPPRYDAIFGQPEDARSTATNATAARPPVTQSGDPVTQGFQRMQLVTTGGSTAVIIPRDWDEPCRRVQSIHVNAAGIVALLGGMYWLGTLITPEPMRGPPQTPYDPPSASATNASVSVSVSVDRQPRVHPRDFGRSGSRGGRMYDGCWSDEGGRSGSVQGQDSSSMVDAGKGDKDDLSRYLARVSREASDPATETREAA